MPGRFRVLIVLQLIVAVAAGVLALPLGLLPSILLFRDLANGTDTNPAAKRHYEWTLWGGLAASAALGAWLGFQATGLIFG